MVQCSLVTTTVTWRGVQHCSQTSLTHVTFQESRYAVLLVYYDWLRVIPGHGLQITESVAWGSYYQLMLLSQLILSEFAT